MNWVLGIIVLVALCTLGRFIVEKMEDKGSIFLTGWILGLLGLAVMQCLVR